LIHEHFFEYSKNLKEIKKHNVTVNYLNNAREKNKLNKIHEKLGPN